MRILASLSLSLPEIHPYELFQMDALFASALVGQRIRLRREAMSQAKASAGGGEDGVWRDVGGGRKERRLSSPDDIYAAMRAGGGGL